MQLTSIDLSVWSGLPSSGGLLKFAEKTSPLTSVGFVQNIIHAHIVFLCLYLYIKDHPVVFGQASPRAELRQHLISPCLDETASHKKDNSSFFFTYRLSKIACSALHGNLFIDFSRIRLDGAERLRRTTAPSALASYLSLSNLPERYLSLFPRSTLPIPLPTPSTILRLPLFLLRFRVYSLKHSPSLI